MSMMPAEVQADEAQSERLAVIKAFVFEKLLGSRLEDGELGDEDELLLSGLVDSHGIMRLIAYLEKRFSLKIHPRDITLKNFRTLQAIDNYLQRKQP